MVNGERFIYCFLFELVRMQMLQEQSQFEVWKSGLEAILQEFDAIVFDTNISPGLEFLLNRDIKAISEYNLMQYESFILQNEFLASNLKQEGSKLYTTTGVLDEMIWFKNTLRKAITQWEHQNRDLRQKQQDIGEDYYKEYASISKRFELLTRYVISYELLVNTLEKQNKVIDVNKNGSENLLMKYTTLICYNIGLKDNSSKEAQAKREYHVDESIVAAALYFAGFEGKSCAILSEDKHVKNIFIQSYILVLSDEIKEKKLANGKLPIDMKWYTNLEKKEIAVFQLMASTNRDHYACFKSTKERDSIEYKITPKRRFRFVEATGRPSVVETATATLDIIEKLCEYELGAEKNITIPCLPEEEAAARGSEAILSDVPIASADSIKAEYETFSSVFRIFEQSRRTAKTIQELNVLHNSLENYIIQLGMLHLQNELAEKINERVLPFKNELYPLIRAYKEYADTNNAIISINDGIEKIMGTEGYRADVRLIEAHITLAKQLNSQIERETELEKILDESGIKYKTVDGSESAEYLCAVVQKAEPEASQSAYKITNTELLEKFREAGYVKGNIVRVTAAQYGEVKGVTPDAFNMLLKRRIDAGVIREAAIKKIQEDNQIVYEIPLPEFDALLLDRRKNN